MFLPKIQDSAGVGKGSDFTAVSTTDTIGVGTLRCNADGTKLYKWVQNVGTGIVLGVPVAYKVDNATLTIVDHPQTANCAMFAGVALATVAANSYCWIQVAGIASCFVLGAAGIVYGTSMKLVNATLYLTTDGAVGTQAIHPSFAMCLVAYATTTAALKNVLLNCLY